MLFLCYYWVLDDSHFAHLFCLKYNQVTSNKSHLYLPALWFPVHWQRPLGRQLSEAESSTPHSPHSVDRTLLSWASCETKGSLLKGVTLVLSAIFWFLGCIFYMSSRWFLSTWRHCALAKEEGLKTSNMEAHRVRSMCYNNVSGRWQRSTQENHLSNLVETCEFGYKKRNKQGKRLSRGRTLKAQVQIRDHLRLDEWKGQVPKSFHSIFLREKCLNIRFIFTFLVFYIA